MRKSILVLLLATSGLALTSCAGTSPGSGGGNPMGFFVTSQGGPRGADFGGLEGADRHCQSLAAAAGAGHRSWRAYLSASPRAGGAVHARDRIGKGPWRNARGEVIAQDVDELHGNNRIDKQTALTERGEPVKGRGDQPNEHDILTGSTPDGRLAEGATCNDWTSSGEGRAMVGHHDRVGLGETAAAKSWNSSHPTRGCGAEALKATGGAGYLYCFAAD
ncbi:hypothetical protein [Caldimonas tepidiphila]|uniref:hypothetical protein n=1 Tax=Caldimonas tepidiphila TaxID=2315841 RepID=UPI000E5AEB56|nr:hypothetical protein [Caldimonas tepidiphila]